MASITPMSFFTPDASINPDEYTFEITDAQVRSDMQSMQGNIAYNENGATASKDYLTGSYLMRGGVFYKVIQTIAAGGTFDPGDGGNIEHVDIASQFGSGGGGSTGCVEVTQAEYDALSEDSKMVDVIYLITDSPDNYLDEVFGDFASVEYTGTASKAYAVGDYLMYNSKFYKVTTAIAQGGTITPGTNVSQTNVGAEIKNTTNYVCAYLVGNPKSIDSSVTIAASSYKDITIDISSNPTKARILSGFSVTGTDSLVPLQIYFNGVNTIQCRFRNVASAQVTGTIYIWYV